MSVFVVSKRNIIIPSPDEKTDFRLFKGYTGTVPDWVPKTAYFKSLVSDGKIILSETETDKDQRKAKAAAEKARKAAEKAAREAAEKVGGNPVEDQDVSSE